MTIDRPSPQLLESIESAVDWLKSARIPNITQIEVDDPSAPKGTDKRIVPDPNGPGLWARFYELETHRPLFVDRDGLPKYSLAEIGYERRNGYAWYGDWPQSLLSRDYPAWKQRIANQGK
jgi:PelA/Pel-15E family pectate lyase